MSSHVTGAAAPAARAGAALQRSTVANIVAGILIGNGRSMRRMVGASPRGFKQLWAGAVSSPPGSTGVIRFADRLEPIAACLGRPEVVVECPSENSPIMRRKSLPSFRWLFALVMLSPGTPCADETAYTPEQAMHFRRVSGLSFSPDGAALVTVVVEFDHGKPRTHLWKLDTSAGELHPWTQAQANDRAPRWAPDGKAIAFLSNRGGEGTQVFMMATDSGEVSVRQLTRAERGVSDFQWSPDGRQIAFLSAESQPEGNDDPQVADREQDLERLWVLDVRSRESRRLTTGRWRI